MTESVAVLAESTGAIDVVSAKQNAASTKRVEKIRSNNFITAIYQVFGLTSAEFCEISRVLKLYFDIFENILNCKIFKNIK